ncbi:cytochrome P450 [Paractinoplanes deccanensis]|uniref:Cytochrome P450 n=1 Tax=Paractinoplanes deccanensis TaxID=113561 RepID=A0A3G5BSF3_9ACTN|nr:cytochrome P450 [Actinoplanes deccanensis]AYW03303.1 cytochrome P450 hydroxylase [Actinoplanes deccanensis]GID80409.1 cytochrome P450 [Actinoplanes deccanensis]
MPDARFPFPESGGAGPAPEFDEIPDRRPCPVSLYGGAPALLLTAYEDVRRVVTDPRFDRVGAARVGLTNRSPDSLEHNEADAPDPARRRRTITTAFTARRAQTLTPEIEAIVAELIDDLRARGGEAEFHDAFAQPLAVRVICRLLGIPYADYKTFGPLVEILMSATAYPPEQVRQAHGQLFAYFAEFYDQRAAQQSPAENDVLTDLIEATRSGEPMSREEAINAGYGLLMAGYETTSHQLAICLYLLLSERDRWERLRAEPELVPTAVEELLRSTSLLSTGGAPHIAAVPATLGDTPVEPGQVMVPVFAAANRDPRAFDRPDEIILDRSPNPHLAFGHGRHVCLGASLARIELTAAISGLLRELPTLRLTGADLKWREGTFIRGLTALPVRW